jgi:hypothetical protein
MGVSQLSCYPSLDHRAGGFSGRIAQGGLLAAEQFISAIGGLLPIALCGRISLYNSTTERPRYW